MPQTAKPGSALRFLEEIYNRTTGLDAKTEEPILEWEVIEKRVYVLRLSSICKGNGTCGTSFDQQVGGIQFRSGFDLHLSPDAQIPLQYHVHPAKSRNKSPEILRVQWGSVYLHAVDDRNYPIRVLLHGNQDWYEVAIIGDVPHCLQPGRGRPDTGVRECLRYAFAYVDRKIDSRPKLVQERPLVPKPRFRRLALRFRGW